MRVALGNGSATVRRPEGVGLTVRPLFTDATGKASAVMPGGGGPSSTVFAQALTAAGGRVELSNAVKGIHGT